MHAGEVCGLELILVSTEAQMRIWNEMTIREHPRGQCAFNSCANGPLVGRQVRYLIGSEYGWLGANALSTLAPMGFAASALQLADRDKWIGWTMEQRRASLHNAL